MKNIGFIGTGNMSTAIISGIFKAKLDVNLYGYDINQEQLYSLTKYSLKACNSLEELCNCSEYIFLAVKPQNFSDILEQIKPYTNESKIFISIAAGITTTYIQQMLGYNAKVVRVMPNTPLLLGQGATALSKEENVSDNEFNFVEKLFSLAGVTQVVPTDKMNEIIAINGSTPAFIYEFTRCFMEYGKSVNLDEDVCLKLFSQTLIGSATMLLESGKSVQELIDMVSSKGGTTIAGLNAFADNNFPEIVKNACGVCVNRAYQLEK